MIRGLIKKIKVKFALNFLENPNPEKIVKIGRAKIIPAFKNVVENVPAYGKILVEKGVCVSEVKTPEDFIKKVPVLVKEDLFPKFDISELCVGGNINGISSAMTSSGFSGVFSYGIVTKGADEEQKQTLDFLLDYALGDGKKLIINCMPMGVSFSSSYPIFKTSVRSSMVAGFLKKFKDKFENIIIFADPHFAKKIVEDGIKSGINWKSFNVSFILGEDWFSNSLSDYISNLTGIDLKKPEKGQIRVTMGLTELGLNIFHDLPQLLKIRGAVQKNKKLRKALFGDLEVCPELMYYYPTRSFIETINNDKNGFGELVFSMLDKNLKMPLIRYNSKDVGKLFSFEKIKKILVKEGYPDLIPEFKLPIAGICGRKGKHIVCNGKKITPELIKEAIYRDFSVAGSITGYFRLSNKPRALLEVQLNTDVKLDKRISLKIQKEIFNLVGINIPIRLYEYERFPYSMKLDYESKFRCI